MAIEDAVVLAHKIMQHYPDYQTAFSEYENERFERTSHVQLSSRHYGDAANVLSSSKEEKYEWLKWPYNGIDVK